MNYESVLCCSDERCVALHLPTAGWEIQTEEHSVTHWAEGQTPLLSFLA